MIKKIKYRYPWRLNNHFQILVDGREYFSSMIEAIQFAQIHILFELYLFESGNTANIFIAELCTAKSRGVNVFLLLDDFGANNLSAADKKLLLDSEIELLHYNPVKLFQIGASLKRDHRKLLIIDNNIAFIGGAGITDKFNPAESSSYWHDVMLKVKGDIVCDFIHSFTTTWNKYKPLALEILPDPSQTTHTKLTHSKARVLLGEGAESNEINRAIISHIHSSKKRVWLTSPYFISSWKVRRALRYAAEKGVDVRLIFPGPYSDHSWITHGIRRYYTRFLKAKIVIHEFQPRFTHSKIILCDDWFTIGSSNLDRWNQYLNLDANIEVYEENLMKQIVAIFELNFSRSNLITKQEWHSRPLKQRIKEMFAGLLISGLGSISRKFRR